MVNEEFWNEKLNLFEIPKFQCPNCQKGFLITTEEQTIKQLTKKADDCFQNTSIFECLERYFVAIARCNNPDCQEITTIVGETSEIMHGLDDGLDHDTFEQLYPPEPKYETIYKVNYTNPAIKLINFPKNTPIELKEIIDKSFILFWVDEAACGNKIRSSVELLLNLQKVKKTTINKKGKRKPLTLNRRVEIFEDKKPKIANHLRALKWIGNQASHENQKLTRKNLIDAYRILEVSLFDLYDNRRGTVNKLTREINKRQKI